MQTLLTDIDLKFTLSVVISRANDTVFKTPEEEIAEKYFRVVFTTWYDESFVENINGINFLFLKNLTNLRMKGLRKIRPSKRAKCV